MHPQTPSRILGGCFVARKGKKRGNGLGEGDKQGGEGRGVQCRQVKILLKYTGSKCTKTRFLPGSAPDPAAGACNAPQHPRRLGR